MNPAWRRATLFAAWVALMLSVLMVRASSSNAGAQTIAASCPPSLVAGGHDYRGMKLTMGAEDGVRWSSFTRCSTTSRTIPRT